MTNATLDTIPPDAIPYPKNAPRWVHDILEIERIASTQKQNQNTKPKTKLKRKGAENG